MKSKTLIWIVLIVIALVLIKIFFLSPKKEGQGQGPGGQKGGAMPPSPVTVYVAVPQELNNEVYATGTIIANEEVMLLPELSGKIVSLNINEGSLVSKGELLVKLADADFQAQLKKLELQVKLAEERTGRQKQLLAVNGISQEEYDVSMNELNSIKADMDLVRANIAKTEVRAPFSGIVGLKYVSEGAYVNPSSRIAAIQQVNPVKIDFSVPEKYAGAIQKNDQLEFAVGEGNDFMKAKVFAVEPKIDINTRSIQIRAIADNGKGALFPGAFTKIKLPLRKIENAIMVPTEAIIPVLKGKKVFVCKNGKAMPVMVETGIRTDAMIQITSGLDAGDSVITTGIMQLKPESPVKIVRSK
jgi:membrane fusion protein (multidrug efflux system)